MTGPTIVLRKTWGFDGWLNGTAPPAVPLSKRTEFMVHYDGATSVGSKTGYAIPLGIHRFHRDSRGWAGIGYNFVIDNVSGAIYEGRGWGLRGSHCPDHNVTAIGVQLHIGGGDVPSPAALRSLRWLYDEANKLTGRTLAKRGHRDGFATECPGDRLYSWVRGGMIVAPAPPPPPIPTTTTTEEDMTTKTELVAALNEWAKSREGALAIQRAVWGAGTYGDPDGDGDADRPIDMLFEVAQTVAEGGAK